MNKLVAAIAATAAVLFTAQLAQAKLTDSGSNAAKQDSDYVKLTSLGTDSCSGGVGGSCGGGPCGGGDGS